MDRLAVSIDTAYFILCILINVRILVRTSLMHICYKPYICHIWVYRLHRC